MDRTSLSPRLWAEWEWWRGMCSRQINGEVRLLPQAGNIPACVTLIRMSWWGKSLLLFYPTPSLYLFPYPIYPIQYSKLAVVQADSLWRVTSNGGAYVEPTHYLPSPSDLLTYQWKIYTLYSQNMYAICPMSPEAGRQWWWRHWAGEPLGKSRGRGEILPLCIVVFFSSTLLRWHCRWADGLLPNYVPGYVPCQAIMLCRQTLTAWSISYHPIIPFLAMAGKTWWQEQPGKVDEYWLNLAEGWKLPIQNLQLLYSVCVLVFWAWKNHA